MPPNIGQSTSPCLLSRTCANSLLLYALCPFLSHASCILSWYNRLIVRKLHKDKEAQTRPLLLNLRIISLLTSFINVYTVMIVKRLHIMWLIIFFEFTYRYLCSNHLTILSNVPPLRSIIQLSLKPYYRESKLATFRKLNDFLCINKWLSIIMLEDSTSYSPNSHKLNSTSRLLMTTAHHHRRLQPSSHTKINALFFSTSSLSACYALLCLLKLSCGSIKWHGFRKSDSHSSQVCHPLRLPSLLISSLLSSFIFFFFLYIFL